MLGDDDVSNALRTIDEANSTSTLQRTATAESEARWPFYKIVLNSKYLSRWPFYKIVLNSKYLSSPIKRIMAIIDMCRNVQEWLSFLKYSPPHLKVIGTICQVLRGPVWLRRSRGFATDLSEGRRHCYSSERGAEWVLYGWGGGKQGTGPGRLCRRIQP